ncbi:sensor histidine kinase [Nocardioides sp. 503]|uniref:sensor histidine kinase n=1 Tax=Nocardioides sp. 503 TaxID=2508326 RepID=UPI0010701300|nr:sensor histidine kinase [Nocardioides sp. 503]
MTIDLDPWRRRLDPLLDPFVAATVCLLSLLPLLRMDDGCGCPPAPWWGYAVVAAQCAPLAVRRLFPFVAPLATGLATMAYGITDLPDPPVPYAALVSLYTVAAYAPRAWANGAGAFAVVGVAAVFVVDWPQWDAEDLSVTVLLMSTAWLLGEAARSRRDRAVQAEARAAQLERARTAESEAAVAAERNRISRELHDVVAHHVSMMVVQAEAGPVVVHGDPDRAAATFDAISAAGKQALAEMRRLLGVLREDEAAPLAPQPGVAALSGLVDGVREAGLDVRLDMRPADEPLPPAVDLTAYRLVQESLTNALRHSGGARVSVEVRTEAGTLLVRVLDDGVGGSVERREGGHGLVAMRERVQLVGGTLEAGPRPGGGWAVSASLPLAAAVTR